MYLLTSVVIGKNCSQDQIFILSLAMRYQLAAILVLSYAWQVGVKFISNPIAQYPDKILDFRENGVRPKIYWRNPNFNCRIILDSDFVKQFRLRFVFSLLSLSVA